MIMLQSKEAEVLYVHIRWDNSEHILLEDIIKTLELNTIIIADSGLGTINATVRQQNTLNLKI